MSRAFKYKRGDILIMDSNRLKIYYVVLGSSKRSPYGRKMYTLAMVKTTDDIRTFHLTDTVHIQQQWLNGDYFTWRKIGTACV
jgi:hypothetical protein